MNQVIEINRHLGIGHITLNRPNVFNSLSTAVHDAIQKAIDEFENDNSVRCLLISANGKHFCTGADLAEVQSLRGSEASIRNFLANGLNTLRRLETSRLPVVVAQQGLALAGGLELILAADVVFASSSAKLGDQHAQFGLVPGWGGSQRLPRIVGRRRAMDLLFSARWLTADEAREWGLVNEVVDDEELLDYALSYCQQLCQRSPDGLALMKRMVDRGLDMPLDQALALELDLAAPALLSEDVSEGLRAFTDKREPQFR